MRLLNWNSTFRYQRATAGSKVTGTEKAYEAYMLCYSVVWATGSSAGQIRYHSAPKKPLLTSIFGSACFTHNLWYFELRNTNSNTHGNLSYNPT